MTNDERLIRQVAARVVAHFLKLEQIEADKESVVCDGIIGSLFLVHTELVPLDLPAMLDGPAEDVAADVVGIDRYLKHKPTRLTGGYHPVFAQRRH